MSSRDPAAFRVEPYTKPLAVAGSDTRVQVIALTFGRARIVTWCDRDPMSLLDGY